MTTHVLWIKNLLDSLGYRLDAVSIGQDNMSTMALANKGRSTNKATKHITMRYFFIHDRIKSGEVRLHHVPTEDMLADFFTKPLQGKTFKAMRDRILNVASL